MRQFCGRGVMSIALLALATGASAQAVKLDTITTFVSPGVDGDNGLPGEAAQGRDGVFYAISIFSPRPTVAFFRIDPVSHSHIVATTLDMGQPNPGASRLVLAPNGQFYASFVADLGGGIVAFDPVTNTAKVVRQFLYAPGTFDPGPDGAQPGPLTVGQEAIRAFYEELVATGRKFEFGDQRPAIINGDLALTSTRLPDGSVTAEVARRQGDGTWLWVIDKYCVA